MIQIAVCDDDSGAAEMIQGIVNEFLKERNRLGIVELFSDGREIIEYNKKFDLIFIDIEMKDMNGIETAERIHKYDLGVTIVYITSYSKYWRSAYRVHVFDFIEKPVEKAK